MKQYPSDLTDKQWEIIKNILNDQRKRKYEYRLIWNAVFYILKSGCQWRMLPGCFPPWKLVYYYYSKWKNNGTIEEIHEILRDMVRKKENRQRSPSAACIDSQSVKTGRVGGVRGIDGGKKIKGRKRHIVVDTLGLLLTVLVHPANIHDSKGAKQVLETLKGRFPRLKTIFADGGYRGKFKKWTKSNFGWMVEIALPKSKANGFDVLPKRWVVERTFAWFESYRRLSKDYEFNTDTSQAMVQLAMIKLMIRRLS